MQQITVIGYFMGYIFIFYLLLAKLLPAILYNLNRLSFNEIAKSLFRITHQNQ
jgi:hypothetical protein